MKYERLEVRLDKEHQLKVAELAAQYGTNVSETVRRAIDEAHGKAMLARRLEAVRWMAEANLEDVPDIEELKRQINEGYDIPDLY